MYGSTSRSAGAHIVVIGQAINMWPRCGQRAPVGDGQSTSRRRPEQERAAVRARVGGGQGQLELRKTNQP
jgi:hypothetical protein